MSINETSPASLRCEANDACDQLYRAHHRSLVSYARLLGCDEHDACDVVQDLFLRMFRRGLLVPLSVKSKEAQRAWLLRTLRWMIFNISRNRARHRRTSGGPLESLDVLKEDGMEFSAVGMPSTELDRAWAADVLDRCLASLRLRTKPAAWPGIESALWGEESGGPVAIRVAAHRARARLREIITLDGCKTALMQAFN